MSTNNVRPIVFTLLTLTGALVFQICAVDAKDKKAKIDGEGIYKQYCASCHLDGGNVTVPSKTVAGSSKLSTLAVFKDYLNNPVGHMPYYKNVVSDEAMLKALYKYCQTLTTQNIRQVSKAPPQFKKI